MCLGSGTIIFKQRHLAILIMSCCFVRKLGWIQTLFFRVCFEEMESGL